MNVPLIIRFHLIAKGTGVGRITGDTYEWNDKLFDVRLNSPDGTETFILRDNTRLISHGSGVNSYLRAEITTIVNNKGDVIINEFSLVESDCKIID